MRPVLPALAVLSVLAAVPLTLAACGKPKTPPPAPPPQAAAPQPLPPPPAPLPEQPPLPADGSPVFPAAGQSYAAARDGLIAQGMVPHVFPNGAAGKKECLRKGPACVFVWTDKTGFAAYVLVATDPAFTTVGGATIALPADETRLGLPPLNALPAPEPDLLPPPSPALDPSRPAWTTQRLPVISGSYAAARSRLLSAGFNPIDAPGAPVVAGMPEVRDCTGLGIVLCQAAWKRDNKTLVVATRGEPAPGDIAGLYWATETEAKGLR